MDRRALMRIAIACMALVAALLAALLFADRQTIWELMLLASLLGAFQAVHMTARQTYAYDIVGPGGAVTGIALVTLAQRIGGMIGALLGGAVIQWWGAGPCAAAMSASYGLGLLALFLLRHQGEAAPTTRAPMRQTVVDYIMALRADRTMLSLMASTGIAEVLGFSHQALLPVLAKDVLHVGAAGLGALTAFRFLGGVVGVLLLSALGEVRRRGLLLLGVLAAFGATEVLLSQSPNFWMALLFVTFVNAMSSVADILHHTLLQLNVPNELRGRAMGSWIVGTGAAPVGHLEIGYLAGVTSARLALLTNGIGLAVMALIMGIALPRLRRL
jgi:predicted MFS family arabinose efflux permease